MNQDLEKALDMCRAYIGPKASVADSMINEAIAKVTQIVKLDESYMKKLKDTLVSLYNIQVGEIQILEGKERRGPWLRSFKSSTNPEQWKFWTRYIQFLKEQKRFAPKVISQLDDVTDKVLDKLFDPRRIDISFSCKKGLVVGHVQSGKTANYVGLMCKAADAGFNLFIVLAGIHNNLRSQTQTRIDEGFLGFDTQSSRAFIKNKTTQVGVGLLPGFDNLIAHSYTTSSDRGDFTSRSANSMGLNFKDPQPLVFVIKKNSTILKSLYSWLKTHTQGDKIKTKSLLIIDDEADNASINTNKAEKNPTAINGYIRQIIDLFTRPAYVGYTATPFANIFIPQNDDDLFPQDFIVNLPIPSNYIGPDKVFGISATVEEGDEPLPIVVPINDGDNFVPPRHRKNDLMPSIHDLPESLKVAIKCFIVTCSIRIARGQDTCHNSMLIHVTRYQSWQSHIRNLVDEQFRFYKSEIEANDADIMEEFRRIFEVDTPNYKSFCTITKEILDIKGFSEMNGIELHTWEEIRSLLYKAVQKIEVKSINGTSGDSLTYYDNEKEGISVIAVGGDKLSRGLTLEGLSISYFLRASKMYDTLMQMGRWFGYRSGYVDLCRLFTSPELNEWFRHITLANEELREEFRYLAESGGIPDDYKLRVRTHPGQLQITSVTKMRYANKVKVSWSGRLVETYQLKRDRQSKRQNLIATDNLLSNLGKYSQVKNNYIWRDVPPERIRDYLSEFILPKQLSKVPLDGIREYIRKSNMNGELISWSVVLMNKKDEAKCEYTFSTGVKVGCFKRTQAQDTDDKTYYIKKNHIVGSQEDEYIDLPKPLLDEALEKTRKIKKVWTKDYPAPDVVRHEVRKKENALLLIYPLNPLYSNLLDEEKKPKGNLVYGLKDEPFIGFAISFPIGSTDNNIEYAVNQVGDYQETEELFDEENDNSYE